MDGASVRVIERLAGWFITWILGVGQAQDGAALGWTDASPKRNHRISSTREERSIGKGGGGERGGRSRPDSDRQ